MVSARSVAAAVVDPEMPMLTLDDLGVLRDVRAAGDAVTVTITPTYSGCPALEAIRDDLRAALTEAGYRSVEVRTVLSPPWSTDWIAPEAKEKLNAFGIAPPHVTRGRVDVTGISPLRHAAMAIACPRCGSTQTKLLSQFGSTACKAQYRCTACLEPFDYFKPH